MKMENENEECCGCDCCGKKTKTVKKGKKVGVKKCPHCKQELVIQEKDGAEVFVCDNCKFKVKKND